MQQEPPPFWRFPPFSALLADSFVEGTDFENGTITLSLKVIEATMNKILKSVAERGGSATGLSTFAPQHLGLLVQGLQLIKECGEISEAASSAEKPEQVLQVIKEIVARLEKLDVGHMMFLPAGWEGLLSRGNVLYIIQRTHETHYSLVVCNPGQGLEYHPSCGSENDNTPPKIKSKDCIRFNEIPIARMTDVAFWSLNLSLWLKDPPSEYHRHEVIYDALLPWLVEGVQKTDNMWTVSHGLIDTNSDPFADWKTPSRSGTSSFRCVYRGLQYALRTMGLTKSQIKQFGFTLRGHLLQWAGEDLVAKYGRMYSEASEAVKLAEQFGLNPSNESKEEGQGEPKRKVLTVTDLKILHYSMGQFALSSLKEHDAGRLDANGLYYCKQLIDTIQNVIDAVPAEKMPGGIPMKLQPDVSASLEHYREAHLLLQKSVEEYAGEVAQATNPDLADLLSLPVKLDNFSQAVAAIIQCDNICEELLKRSTDSSTASRLVLQMQVISTIGTLFTEILPIPAPVDCPLDSKRAKNCIWRNDGSIVKELQLACLERIHKLALKYSSVWQAIERPTRDYDAQRGLVAACMLAFFDVVVRIIAVPEPLVLSELLWEDGGYCVFSGVCTNNRPFDEICATMEIVTPSLTKIRNQTLDYLNSVHRASRNSIFEFRQPDKVEIKKYGSTVIFLRKMLERCGYELIRRDNPNPPPEIEALMEWFCSDRTDLAQDHPEFSWFRNVAVLFKFLSTMETRETEQLRRRQAVNPYMYWKLSADDDGGRKGWGWGSTSQVEPLMWEAVNFRGQDLNTADVTITGFGDRELVFGEGPVVQSPADVSTIISLPMPTEDDILHADKLPTYGDTLSRAEAEALLSYLTVDYVRIPLIVGFFASNDRVTYLFNSQLRDLLRAVLFEGGPWISQNDRTSIKRVPVRRTAQQQQAYIEDRFMLNIPEETRALGTPDGLLLNELLHSPSATLDPLLKMFDSLKDLSDATVYSADATFILYIIMLAVDVDSYVVYAIEEAQRNASEASEANLQTSIASAESAEQIKKLQQYHQTLQGFLHGLAGNILHRWVREMEQKGDIETASVVHSYLALLWTSLRPNELNASNVEALLSSIAYVRNWHGFGLGQNRSDVLWDSSEGSYDPETRLLRFLQAQGIDTSRINKTSMEQYLQEASKRPLFLHFGRKTVRAPRLVKVKDKNDPSDTGVDIDTLPPADVPEDRLFSLLQKHRRALVAWLDAAPQKIVDSTLQKIIQIALRSDKFEYTGWTRMGRGRYVAEKAEIKFDAQAAEVFWRNNELKPVPDSMTRFNDFEGLFGSRAFYCGLVLRNKHRHWVHLVGTEYDLQEWDKPIPADLGVGIPKPPPAAPKPDEGGRFCLICGEIDKCFVCETCTVANCKAGTRPGTLCKVCGTPKGGVMPPQDQDDYDMGIPMGMPGMPGMMGGMGRGRNKKPEPVKADRVIYNGVIYSRAFNLYSEDPHPHEVENWAVDILKNVLMAEYPPMPPTGKMEWTLLFTEEITSENADRVRLLGCDGVDKPEATWKEVLIMKQRKMLFAFNLISHGRRVFKQLIYTNDARFTFHNLPMKPKGAYRYAAGDFKKKRTQDDSLVITRQNVTLGGKETYIPPRLLHGIVPSVLLEAFHMWQGEDDIIRGTPVEEGSQWFNYQLEINFHEDKEIVKGEKPWSLSVTRRPTHVSALKIKTSEKVASSALLRGSDLRLVDTQDTQKEMIESAVLQLTGLGYPPSACRLALKKNENDIDSAASWLLDENNLPDILAAAMLEEQAPAPGEMSDRQGYLPILESEGFPRSAAQYALDLMGGDLNLAKSWLLDDSNRSQIEMLQQAELEDQQMETEPTSLRTSGQISNLRRSGQIPFLRRSGQIPIDERAADLVLVNLLEVQDNSPLHRLGSMLTRLEDFSHVLVWASTYNLEDDSSNIGKITVIELPRLKAKFAPRKDEDGVVRLYLLDHEGWFISDNFAVHQSNDNMDIDSKSPSGLKFLNQILQGIENCLVLENQSQEIQVMIANMMI